MTGAMSMGRGEDLEGFEPVSYQLMNVDLW